MIRRDIAELIQAAPRTPETERAEWMGQTARAKFQGAANADKARRVSFGRRNK